MSLKDSASKASSWAPSTGTGAGERSAARLRAAFATRRTGREIARASRNDASAASAAPAKAARRSPPRNGLAAVAPSFVGRRSTSARFPTFRAA
jgi:hypothetical protein